MALTQVDQGLLGTNAQYTGFKNRIINGAMGVSQRLGTSSSNISSDSYTMDRWLNRVSGGGVITNQQTTSVLPTGFSYALALTVQTADSSIAAGDVYELEQRIEGFNTQDLAWGTASASTVTLSFWVRSSVTGTYGVGIQSSSYGRSYVTTYSIGSANTWTYITLTIPGDTGATQNNGNGIGVGVNFDLGSGTSSNTTAGSWGTGGSYWRTSSCVNWIANSGATFYITGVQLEKGSTATSFDYRPYGTELALCQRYYYKASSSGGFQVFGFGYVANTTDSQVGVQFPVTMRSVPTFTSSAANTFYLQDPSTNRTPSAMSLQTASVFCASVVATITGGTAGQGCKLIDQNAVSYLGFSSEL
jgi:hypothetical protein